ncbi:hypothetical protein C8Q77DRAFT_582014 [Trametes polyzona]|nr:hypothetical protein C8Q77DRAFT_582014 [Trametes polyzona]
MHRTSPPTRTGPFANDPPSYPSVPAFAPGISTATAAGLRRRGRREVARHSQRSVRITTAQTQRPPPASASRSPSRTVGSDAVRCMSIHSAAQGGRQPRASLPRLYRASCAVRSVVEPSVVRERRSLGRVGGGGSHCECLSTAFFEWLCVMLTTACTADWCAVDEEGPVVRRRALRRDVLRPPACSDCINGASVRWHLLSRRCPTDSDHPTTGIAPVGCSTFVRRHYEPFYREVEYGPLINSPLRTFSLFVGVTQRSRCVPSLGRVGIGRAGTRAGQDSPAAPSQDTLSAAVVFLNNETPDTDDHSHGRAFRADCDRVYRLAEAFCGGYVLLVLARYPEGRSPFSCVPRVQDAMRAPPNGARRLEESLRISMHGGHRRWFLSRVDCRMFSPLLVLGR